MHKKTKTSGWLKVINSKKYVILHCMKTCSSLKMYRDRFAFLTTTIAQFLLSWLLDDRQEMFVANTITKFASVPNNWILRKGMHAGMGTVWQFKHE